MIGIFSFFIIKNKEILKNTEKWIISHYADNMPYIKK